MLIINIAIDGPTLETVPYVVQKSTHTLALPVDCVRKQRIYFEVYIPKFIFQYSYVRSANKKKDRLMTYSRRLDNN